MRWKEHPFQDDTQPADDDDDEDDLKEKDNEVPGGGVRVEAGGTKGDIRETTASGSELQQNLGLGEEARVGVEQVHLQWNAMECDVIRCNMICTTLAWVKRRVFGLNRFTCNGM